MNRYIVFEGKITKQVMDKLFDEYTNIVLQKQDENVGVKYSFTDFDDEVGEDLVDFICRQCYALDAHHRLTALQIASDENLLEDFCRNPMLFCEPKIKWDIDPETNQTMLKRLAKYCKPETTNFLKFLKDEMFYVYFVDRFSEELSTIKKISDKEYFELLSDAINTKGKETEEGRGNKIRGSIMILAKQIVPA